MVWENIKIDERAIWYWCS